MRLAEDLNAQVPAGCAEAVVHFSLRSWFRESWGLGNLAEIHNFRFQISKAARVWRSGCECNRRKGFEPLG